MDLLDLLKLANQPGASALVTLVALVVIRQTQASSKKGFAEVDRRFADVHDGLDKLKLYLDSLSDTVTEGFHRAALRQQDLDARTEESIRSVRDHEDRLRRLERPVASKE